MKGSGVGADTHCALESRLKNLTFLIKPMLRTDSGCPAQCGLSFGRFPWMIVGPSAVVLLHVNHYYYWKQYNNWSNATVFIFLSPISSQSFLLSVCLLFTLMSHPFSFPVSLCQPNPLRLAHLEAGSVREICLLKKKFYRASVAFCLLMW